MNITREMNAINRKVKAQVDQMGDDALRRIGIDPEAERIAARQRQLDAFGEAIGRSARAFLNGIEALAAALNRGFEGPRN